MRQESDASRTLAEWMAPGRRISRSFLWGSPSGKEGSKLAQGTTRSWTRERGTVEAGRAGFPSGSATEGPEPGVGEWLGGALRPPLRFLQPPACSPSSSRRYGSAPTTPLPAAGTGSQEPDPTRADQKWCGAQHLQTQRRSHSHPHRAAGLALPPRGTAIPPPGPRPRPVPELQPRQAPGLRPRGDIRALGSGSRPHLRAPATAGEAPNPTPGGGSAERPRCPGSRPPLPSVGL